jgi:pyroglutamyl-peptidase
MMRLVRPLVLVTGFGPFLTHAKNPSEVLARKLATVRGLPVRFEALVLPVVLGEAARVALAAARTKRPIAIVSLGLAAQTPHVRIEHFGRNRTSGRHADNAGRRRPGEIVKGGAAMLRTSIDTRPLRAALREAGIDAKISRSAGAYVCNDLYYRLLLRDAVPALFVHVPTNAHRLRGIVRALAEGIAAAVLAGRGDTVRRA